MRLFEEYGTPSTAGDITYIDYLFLGDYVDRGSHSLETICLLLALKIEHPSAVHLIRGNHEVSLFGVWWYRREEKGEESERGKDHPLVDFFVPAGQPERRRRRPRLTPLFLGKKLPLSLQAADINALFGFRLECIERLGDPHGVWAWTRLNALFNYLPLAALIEDRILCMHGGIGRSISRIEQIAELQRPLKMEDGGLVLMDLLWSDPTTNDAVEGVQPSPRGPGLVTFGPDRVIEFCKENELQMIVRAHECVMDGFERFAQGHLITLFSATNYCGTANNAGEGGEKELIFILFGERRERGRGRVFGVVATHKESALARFCLFRSAPSSPTHQRALSDVSRVHSKWFWSKSATRIFGVPRATCVLPARFDSFFL